MHKYEKLVRFKSLSLRERVELQRAEEEEKHAAYLERHAKAIAAQEKRQDPSAAQQLSLF